MSDPQNPNAIPVGQTDATPQPTSNEAEEAVAKEALRFALAPNVLDRIADLVQEHGVAGEGRIIRILYLVLTSRLLARPVSLIVKGHSSGGKSFLLKAVLRLFPPSAYWLRSSISPKLLVRTLESFKHRVLVFEEVAGLSKEAELFLRLLLSEGQLVYSTLEMDKAGKWTEVTFTKEGPAGLVLTTTELGIHSENETRMLSVSINDTKEQTKNALRASAKTRGAEADLSGPQAFQDWLANRPAKVRIPFLKQLAEGTAPIGMRIRRDFNLVASLVEAHALLHQLSRARDVDGFILADKRDYAAVYFLVGDLISQGVDASVPAAVRETVETVSDLLVEHPSGVPGIAVSKALGIDKSNASRRIAEALSGGYLRNLEEGKGKPQRLIPGDPLPDGSEILPHPDTLDDGCAVAPVSNNAPHEEPEP